MERGGEGEGERASRGREEGKGKRRVCLCLCLCGVERGRWTYAEALGDRVLAVLELLPAEQQLRACEEERPAHVRTSAGTKRVMRRRRSMCGIA
eukprot:459917-Rhodomonas_salina.1